ncbi:MAG: GNAT family N-acetyltransferase [Promethearchaeota archaeon]
MVKKRLIFFGMIIITSFILQIIALSCFIPVKSDHDIEFDYVYKWKLNGKTGDYYDYDEKMTTTGHYVVDFDGDVANVIAEFSWKWKATYQGSYYDSAEGADEYIFQFSLIDGKYIGYQTDQDEYHPDMGVWFYIPNIETTNSHKILTGTYQKSQVKSLETIWIRSLSPQLGYKFTDTGNFHRNDEYGNMDATYRSDYYFTKEGYLLGEIYSESDKGYSNGYYSTYDVNSKVFVYSSNYGRSLNYFYFLLCYWLPIIVVYGYAIALKNYNIRRRKHINYREKTLIFQPNIDFKIENADFSSIYKSLIPAFVWRTYRQEGKVYSITDDNKLKGLALIDAKGKVGTLFGKYQSLMIKQTKIDYFFTENTQQHRYHCIDNYDILRIPNLSAQNFDYNAFLVNPLAEKYVPAVVDLISNEDFGKVLPEVWKWVHQAISNEIAYVAIANIKEPWVKEILDALETKKFPPPEAVEEDVIMGVGFAVIYQDIGWLYGLYVHPAFRNLGIGRNLALARLSALKELGAKEVLTEIGQWNGPAKKIYENFNTKTVGKIYLYGKKKPTVRIRRR